MASCHNSMSSGVFFPIPGGLPHSRARPARSHPRSLVQVPASTRCRCRCTQVSFLQAPTCRQLQRPRFLARVRNSSAALGPRCVNCGTFSGRGSGLSSITAASRVVGVTEAPWLLPPCSSTPSRHPSSSEIAPSPPPTLPPDYARSTEPAQMVRAVRRLVDATNVPGRRCRRHQSPRSLSIPEPRPVGRRLRGIVNKLLTASNTRPTPCPISAMIRPWVAEPR